MSVLSGMGGAVDGSSTVRGWSINHSADLQAFIASNTKGGTVRIKGNKDWTGQYTGYGHTPARMPGDSFLFKGSVDGTNGCQGTAIVNEVTINWDIEASGIVNHVVSFEGNSDLTLGAVAATDVTLPTVYSSMDCKLEESDALAVPSFSEISDIRTMTLTITRNNPSYVSSSTAGIVKRVVGNWDFTFSYTLYEGDPANFIAVNTVKQLRAYVDATLFWDMKWVRYGELSDVEVDIEAATIVGATQNTQMEGFTDISGTTTEGLLADPTPTTIWPE